MPTNTDDVVWVDVLPSLAGFTPKLRAGLKGATTEASVSGASAGRAFGTSFGTSAASAIDSAATKVAAAQKRAADAAGQLTVAQSKLTDVQAAGTASASRVAAAEEAVAKAQRNVTLSTDAVTAAQRAQVRVQSDVTAASEAAAGKQAALTARTAEAGVASKAFNGTLGTLRGSLGMVTTAMTGLPGLAVGGALFLAAKGATQFNASMKLIQTQAGASADEVARMTPAVLALTGKVAQAPEALATSLYHVESTGLRAAKAEEAVKVAAEGASVGHADLEETTNALTATIASGMLPATESYAQAMGQLTTIVGSGDMKMSDLNEALGTGLLVTTKQYGITIRDVGAALADFGDNNIRGADAATLLRMAVQAIAKPGVGAAAALAQIGLTVKQLQSDEQTGGLNKALTDLHGHLVSSGIDASRWGGILTDAFTKKAGAGLITLVGTFGRFQQKYQEVSRGADSFGAAWAATTKTAAFQFAALRDSVDGLGIRLGNVLLPGLTHVASWLTATGIPAVEGFSSKVSGLFHSPAVSGFESTVQGLFNGLKAGASAVIPVIGALAGDVGHLVSSFVSSGGLSSAATVVGTAFAGLVEVFRGVSSVTLPAVSGLVHWFGELPGPVQATVVAFVALRAAMAAGWLDGFALRALYVGDALKKMAATTVGSLGTMRAAYRETAAQAAFLSTVQGDSTGLAKARGAISGLGAAAGAAAKGGLSAMKSGASGLMSLFGGPWGVALLGAGIGVSALINAVNQHNAAVKADTQQVTDWYKAIASGGQPAITAATDLKNKQQDLTAAQAKLNDMQAAAPGIYAAAGRGAAGYNAAIENQKQKVKDLSTEVTKGKQDWDNYWRSLSPQQQIASTVAADEANLALALQHHAAGSREVKAASDVYNADLEKQKQLSVALTTAEQTQIDKLNALATAQLGSVGSAIAAEQAQSQFSTAVSQYASDATDGQHSTKALADESLSLAQQAISTAQAVAKAKVDQMAANGVTDDGTVANATLLASLKETAKQISGPGHDKIMGLISDLEHTTVAHGNVADAVGKMGLTVQKTWDKNTLILGAATSQQITDLHNLGYTVTKLPNGKIVVTSDTKPAVDEINKMLAYYRHQALTLQATLPSNGAVVGNGPARASFAAGGLFRGAGTGTSDSNLVAISDHEFIVNAAATQANLGLLHAINSGAVKGFAAGGLVGGSTMQVGTVTPVVHMDTNGVARQLAGLIAAARTALASVAAGAPSSVSANAALAQRMGASLGWGSGAEWNAWYALGQRESGWRNTAQNPTSTAYGIAQFLDSTWSSVGISKTSDAATQILGMERYIKGRYGDPIGAMAHENRFGWYHAGGTVQGPAGATVPAFVQVGERVLTAPEDHQMQQLVQATIAASRESSPRTVIYDQREVYAHVDYRQLSRQMAQDQHTSEWLAGG